MTRDLGILACFLAVIAVALLVTGCCNSHPDLPWCGAEPPGPGPGPVPEWKIEATGPRIDLPKAISVVCHDGAVFDSSANVYHGSHKSWIRRNGARVYQGGQETISLWQHASTVYGTVEHGSHILRWDGTAFVNAAPRKGGWSVVGWGNLVPFNNEYRSPEGVFVGTRAAGAKASFRDEPRFYDCDSGAHITTMPVKAMPRTIVRHRGKVYVSANFGRECLGIYDGSSWEIHDSPAVTLASFNGKLYGGYGMKAGPSQYKQADGRIGRWRGGSDWEVLHDTGCYAVTDAVVLNDCILWVGTDPDRLTMQRGEEFALVFERPGADSNADRDRSFGGCADVDKDGVVWVVWSDRGDWSQMYRIERVRP
jgi:hypothetical protein